MHNLKEREYAFDAKLFAALRVKARSEREARQLLRDAIECATANLGVVNGEPLVCEVTLDGELDLYEIDGESVW